jgi:hypothetical protein
VSILRNRGKNEMDGRERGKGGREGRREGRKAYLDGEGVLDEEDARGQFVLLDLVHAARRQLLLDVGLDFRVGAWGERQGRDGEEEE